MIGWLLDTNVVAELARATPAPKVAAWADSQVEDTMFISALTLGEYEKGIAHLPAGSPTRPQFEAALLRFERRFAGRVLPVSDAAVRRWGRISGTVKRATAHAPPVIDTLLAATAIEFDLHLATRNVRDVARSGASIFDPWHDDPALFPLA